MDNKIIEELKQIVNIDNIKLNENMSKHTTYKIGGIADVFISPTSKKHLIDIIRLCKKNNTDFFILGKGSNLLVSDEGFRGVVINIGNGIDRLEIKGDEIYAEAGVALVTASYNAYKNSLKGLEFGCGIPGTIGGAIYMNAGAYGGDMKSIITEVEILNKDDEIEILTNEQMKFDYRYSILKDNGGIVLSAKLKLIKENQEAIQEVRERLKQHRQNAQPLEFPNAGSVFKRPEGYFPGKLIEDLGLKGYTIGGAQVSTKHANFIINTGNATAKDVIELIKYIQKSVFEAYGVNMETEIKMLGNF